VLQELGAELLYTEPSYIIYRNLSTANSLINDVFWRPLLPSAGAPLLEVGAIIAGRNI